MAYQTWLADDYTGPAIWKNATADESVVISGLLGEQGGVRFFSITSSTTGIDERELFPPAAPIQLPSVVTNGRQFREVYDDAVIALVTANVPPVVFRRDGALVRVAYDEAHRPIIRAISDAGLQTLLSRCANFFVTRKANGATSLISTDPPLDIVRAILHTADSLEIPHLIGITQVPTLRPNGTILQIPGYDAETGLFYAPAPDLNFPAIPNTPTQEDARLALEKLREPFCDFPFNLTEKGQTDGSADNALALLLTPIIRPAVDGPVPLGVVTAPQQGTGKGKLMDCISIIATGKPAKITQLTKGEELRKNLTTMLMEGDPIISFDNVEGLVSSPILASVLTSIEWGDRLLGENKSTTVPNRATWAVTGNNIRLGGDLARRCYFIRLDAKIDKPWLREGFRHKNLMQWVKDERGQLIAAALTLARAWYVAGCPQSPVVPIGSYEQWTRIVSGMLFYAGATNLLGNLNEVYEQADEETSAWEVFLSALAKHFDGKPVTVSVVMNAVTQYGGLSDVAPDLGDDITGAKYKTRLGNEFKKRVGRRHGKTQARVERGAMDRTKAVTWLFLTECAEGAEGAEAENGYSAGAQEDTQNLQQQNVASAASSASALYDAFAWPDDGEFAIL